jgi:hypothetical protein
MAQSNIISVWTIRETSPDVFTIPARPAVPVIHMGGTAYEAPSPADRAARRVHVNALMQEIGDDHITIAGAPAGRMRISRRLVLIGGNLAAWGLLGGILALLGAV